MTMDPEYLRLYHEYAAAIQMFEIARQKRQRDREQLTARRNSPPPVRRPVGSPTNFWISQDAPTVSAATTKPPERKIYMGEILGWATIVPASASYPAGGGGEQIDLSKFYDDLSRQLYWNAQKHYQDCKRAFFDYVRRQNISEHREKARDEAMHVANLQMLGVETQGNQFTGLKQEIEAACRNALALYRSAPNPKSDAMKIILLENLADAMLVGLDDGSSSTVSAMVDEMNTLINLNLLKVHNKTQNKVDNNFQNVK